MRPRPASSILSSPSYNIFNEAMSAVLVMMDGNFSAAFKRTEGYKKLEKHVQDEAEELERLRKVPVLCRGA